MGPVFVGGMMLACGLWGAVLVGIGLGKVIRYVCDSLERDEGTNDTGHRGTGLQERQQVVVPPSSSSPQTVVPFQNVDAPVTQPWSGPLWANHRLWEGMMYEQTTQRVQGNLLGNMLRDGPPQAEREDPFRGPDATQGWRYQRGQTQRL